MIQQQHRQFEYELMDIIFPFPRSVLFLYVLMYRMAANSCIYFRTRKKKRRWLATNFGHWKRCRVVESTLNLNKLSLSRGLRTGQDRAMMFNWLTLYCSVDKLSSSYRSGPFPIRKQDGRPRLSKE